MRRPICCQNGPTIPYPHFRYRKNPYQIWSNNDCFLCSQFQGLFNPLFWVLFTFPTRYLYSIGLRVIFSFRRKIPPILRLHSKAARLFVGDFHISEGLSGLQGCHLLWRAFPGDYTHRNSNTKKIYLMGDPNGSGVVPTDERPIYSGPLKAQFSIYTSEYFPKYPSDTHVKRIIRHSSALSHIYMPISMGDPNGSGTCAPTD